MVLDISHTVIIEVNLIVYDSAQLAAEAARNRRSHQLSHLVKGGHADSQNVVFINSIRKDTADMRTKDIFMSGRLPSRGDLELSLFRPKTITSWRFKVQTEP